uniref:Calponin-homology (CH) domain-containing protein n=1 Tax=Sinocyclocheilus anshuiensis TaxID=1608454 RepID=A0A671LY72_9TELE
SSIYRCLVCSIFRYRFVLPFLSKPDEREAVQKKTFTKWVNSILARVSCRISDLYLDLRDGRMLIKLLEVLSGERLVSVRC